MKIVETKRKETSQAVTFLITIEFMRSDIAADNSNPKTFREEMAMRVMNAVDVVSE